MMQDLTHFDILMDALVRGYYTYATNHLYYAMIFAVVTIIVCMFIIRKFYIQLNQANPPEYAGITLLMINITCLLLIIYMIDNLYKIFMYGIFYIIRA